MPLDGLSQKSNPRDTICISIKDGQDCAIAKKRVKSKDSLIFILRSDVSILSREIKGYERMIKQYVGKDSLNKDIKKTFQSIVNDRLQQKLILEAEIKKLEKQVKRLKIKLKVVSAAGLVATGIAVWFGVFR